MRYIIECVVGGTGYEANAPSAASSALTKSKISWSSLLAVNELGSGDTND